MDDKTSIKVNKDSAEKLANNGYVEVACRICGEVWLYPEKIAKQFDSEHGLECIYCRRKRERYGWDK